MFDGNGSIRTDHAPPEARRVFSCGWHITREGGDVYFAKARGDREGADTTVLSGDVAAAPRGLLALCQHRVTVAITTGDSPLAKVGEEPSTASKTH